MKFIVRQTECLEGVVGYGVVSFYIVLGEEYHRFMDKVGEGV